MRLHRAPSFLLCAAVLVGAVAPTPAGAVPALPAAQQQPSELERLEKERQEKAKEAERQKGKGGLVLPRPKVDAPAPTTPATSGAAPTTAAQETPGERTPDVILAELATREKFQASEARGYAEELLAHGDNGLAAARRGLSSESHPVLLSCARAVLLAEDPAGMGILRGRLSRELPTEAIAPLLRAVDELAPASMSGSDLVALLDHPQSTMRSAVERLLSERIGPADLPLVERALAAERTDTRLRAIELLGAIAGDGALALLFAQLSDGRPQVAQRAAEILAVRPDASIAPRLLESAFASGALFRGQCYALLALVEREDLRGEALVGPEHVDLLVQNLSSVSVFARSTAAVVLAGVGYRLEDEVVPEWYRLGVPHELVSVVVGNEYHRDFAALQGSALRRLEQISGRTFGNDGPAWKSWWITSAMSFTPRRATLPGGEAAVASIRVEWLGSGGEVIRLAAEGARVAPRDEAHTFVLDEIDARALVAALEEQGLLSAARIPAAPRTDASERLAIGVGGLEKTFTFPLGLRPEHVDRVLEELRDLNTNNDWQALRDPQLPGGPRASFNVHAAQWRELRAAPGEAGMRARALRRKELALAALVTMDPVKRGAVLDELVEAARTEGVVQASDAAQLIAIVDSEPYHSPRTAEVVRLLLDASRSSAGGPIDLVFGRDVFERVHDRFRGGALESLETIVHEVGLELARELAYDERALARSVAAGVLVHSTDPADTARIEILLAEGEVELVQEAALIAVGRAQRKDLAHLVLARVELAPARVRRAAAEALGELRPDGALDALVTCFTSEDFDLQRAALLAIARIDDETARAIVVRMLGRGPTHPLFETARAACLELGPKVRVALAELALRERAAGSDEAAYVLAEIGAPEAVPALLGLLAHPGPTAERAAEELAVLTCLDLRTRADRSLAWKAWWEGAAQDEPLAWLRDAQMRLGLPVAPPGSLESGGSLDGALALAASVAAPAGVVSERARRELARLLGEEVSAAPSGQGLERWRSNLDAAIARRFANG